MQQGHQPTTRYPAIFRSRVDKQHAGAEAEMHLHKLAYVYTTLLRSIGRLLRLPFPLLTSPLSFYILLRFLRHSHCID